MVTGASGVLGRELLNRFRQANWERLGLAFSRARGGLKKVDLRERAEVESVLEDFQPQAVVHAAAERRIDVAENDPDAMEALNVSASRHLAELCSRRGIFLLYVGSSYVFDGRSPPYEPGDATNPVNAYGRSKLNGEREVLSHLGHAVLRVPILYGPVEFLGENTITKLFSSVLRRDQPAKISDYEPRYPTHVGDIAGICVQLCEKRLAEGVWAGAGVWHWNGSDRLTKYEMARVMANMFDLPSSHLVPLREPSLDAPRPFDCHLDRSATEIALSVTEQTPFKGGIYDVLLPHMK